MILHPSTLVENKISPESCLVYMYIYLPILYSQSKQSFRHTYYNFVLSYPRLKVYFMCLIMSKCTDNVSEI